MVLVEVGPVPGLWLVCRTAAEVPALRRATPAACMGCFIVEEGVLAGCDEELSCD